MGVRSVGDRDAEVVLADFVAADLVMAGDPQANPVLRVAGDDVTADDIPVRLPGCNPLSIAGQRQSGNLGSLSGIEVNCTDGACYPGIRLNFFLGIPESA
jgi:hypothetical protein